ncbi:hypothetical protein C2E31_22280 [Rhodopirellula baltica]|nr:hypothetical protein C2E31_22280 [Rhodopirellula baltica]
MQRHLSGLLGRWFTLVVLPFALQQCSLNEELQAEELDVIQVTSGFLFIDGKYLAPPYDIECEEGVLTINGEEYKLEYFRDPPPQPEPSTEPETQANSSADRDPGEASSVEVTPTRFARDPDPFRRGAESYRRDAESFRNDPGRSGQGFERRDWRRWGPRGFGGYGGFRPYLYSIEMYANDVQQATLGGIVVMYPKRKPLVVYPTGDGYRLLQLLMGKTDIKSAPPKHLTPDSQSSWEQLATGFQPSGDFFERAKAELNVWTR